MPDANTPEPTPTPAPETSAPSAPEPTPEPAAAPVPTPQQPAPAPASTREAEPELPPAPKHTEQSEGPAAAPAAGPAAPPESHPTQEAEAAAAHDEAILAESRRHTRRSFLAAGAATAAGIGFYEWLANGPRREDQPVLLRKAYQANAALFRGIFNERGLAPTYSLRKAENLRTNGIVGLQKAMDMASWRLQVVGAKGAAGRPEYVPDVTAWQYRYTQPMHMEKNGAAGMAPPSEQAAMQSKGPFGRDRRGLGEAGESASTLPVGTPGLLLTMDAIKRLPHHEFVTQFKCIEGWSQYVHWGGVRLADFLEEYPPERVNGRDPRYVYMETPEGDYYTGYNLQACRHPQSLLVTEMMGAPITQLHGAPLRLHMPIKYGYKQIKRIGLIRYMDRKPDDYWTKLGYDWYAGL